MTIEENYVLLHVFLRPVLLFMYGRALTTISPSNCVARRHSETESMAYNLSVPWSVGWIHHVLRELSLAMRDGLRFGAATTGRRLKTLIIHREFNGGIARSLVLPTTFPYFFSCTLFPSAHVE